LGPSEERSTPLDGSDLAPPSPARARPHDATAWLPLPDPGALPSIEELLTRAPWDIHEAVGLSPGRAEPHDAASWLPLTAVGADAPDGPDRPDGPDLRASVGPIARGWWGKALVGLLVVASVVVAGTVLPRLTGSASTVDLSVDGVTRRLDTSAATVGSFLRDQHVRLARNDRVVPAPNAVLQDGVTVRVMRAFPITVDLDGEISTVRTAYVSPTDFVRRDLGLDDTVSIRSAPQRLETSSTIIVRTRHTGRLSVDGQDVAYDVAAVNVAELLAEYSVELGPDDHMLGPSGSEVTRDARLTEGAVYSVVRIGRNVETADQSYTVPDERRADDALSIGQTRVRQGHPGTIRTTYQVTYQNGTEVDRKVLSKVPVASALSTITYYGTKADPMWDKIAQCESRGNWSVVDSEYSGGLGIFNGTWDAWGGRDFATNAGLATREEQIIVAERIRASVGLSGWGCAHILGYVH
ncbi:MAG: transglycosylase family protein, partial [Actinomycetes bacterium]